MRFFIFSAEIFGAALFQAPFARAAELFAARPTQVVHLLDRNADGDFFDAAESLVYADLPGASLRALVCSDDAVFALDSGTPAVLRLLDANADGDALDAGEVLLYAQLPPGSWRGMARSLDGEIFTADAATGTLYALRDLNSDGDALDAQEVATVADSLSFPTAVGARPDGALLVAQNLAALPVRILSDHTADGGFYDFAENISYAENGPPAAALAVVDDQIAYLAAAAQPQIHRLIDRTLDGDVLDASEVELFAELPAVASAVVRDAADLYAVVSDAPGSLLRIRDVTGDGDALDAGETLVVADGLTDATAIAAPAAAPACLPGDADANGLVAPPDIPLFVQTILAPPPDYEPCRYDLNADGSLNGADVAGFASALLN